MALKPEDFQKVTQHLLQYWGPRFSCNQCNKPEAQGRLAGYVSVAFSDEPSTMALGGAGQSFVTVTCSVCGHTRFVDISTIEGVGRTNV